MRKLTEGEVRAYRELAAAARKLRQAQRVAEHQRLRTEKRAGNAGREIQKGR
jgi:hypothetical protein